MSGCQQALSAEKAVPCPMQGTAFANESHKKNPACWRDFSVPKSNQTEQNGGKHLYFSFIPLYVPESNCRL